MASAPRRCNARAEFEVHTAQSRRFVPLASLIAGGKYSAVARRIPRLRASIPPSDGGEAWRARGIQRGHRDACRRDGVKPEDQRDQDWRERPCNACLSLVRRRPLAIPGAVNARARHRGNIPSAPRQFAQCGWPVPNEIARNSTDCSRAWRHSGCLMKNRRVLGSTILASGKGQQKTGMDKRSQCSGALGGWRGFAWTLQRVDGSNSGETQPLNALIASVGIFDALGERVNVGSPIGPCVSFWFPLRPFHCSPVCRCKGTCGRGRQ